MRRRILQILAGLAVSALAVWLTLRGKDLGEIWLAMRQGDYRYLVLYVPFWAVIDLSRTYRWGLLLEPVARVSFGKLNAASCVGWMALTLLPFRLGEFARPYLIAERPRLRVSAALSSVVVERVADGIFTTLLLAACLLAVPGGSPGVRLIRTAGVIVTTVFLGALVFLVLAYRNRAGATRLLERILTPVSSHLAGRIAGMMEAFTEGLRLVPSRRKVALFFALTCLYWGTNGWGMAVLAEGFGLHLSFLQGATLLGVLVIGVMIPAGPGMVGTFQGALVLGLGLFFPRQVVARQGVAFANVLWATQTVFQVGLGLVFLFSRHIRIGQILAAPAEVGEELDEEAISSPAGERAGALHQPR